MRSWNDSLVLSHAVQHGLYRHVGRKQVVCARDHISIPSYSFTLTSGAPSFRLSVRRVSRILALHRTTPRRTYTLISPPPSNERGKAKASKVSTAAWEQTLFASSLGRVSRSSCMRIWRGCFGRPLSGGNRGGRAVECHSSRQPGRKIIVSSTSHVKA